MARITLALIIINAAVFIAQLISDPVTELFALTPTVAVSGAYWQFFTYMFLHGGFTHIILNMFVLFIFGIMVEKALGSSRYLILYLVSGVGSSVLYLALTGISSIPMLGASGAVFAVLTAYGFLFPKNIIFVPPGIPLPARFAVILFAGLELFLGLTEMEPGIANFGHLGGIITGALLMLYWRQKEKKQKAMELKGYEFIWE